MSSCSSFLPLHEGLVVASDGENAISLEDNVSHKLRVSTVSPALMALSDGVTEEAYIAPVVTS